MLVRLANWLRCRKLAKASPGDAWLAHWLRAAAAPKYCNKPMTLLTRPANAQACAAAGAQRCAKPAPPLVSPDAESTDTVRIRTAVAISATSQGTTAGEGPGASGFNEGSAKKAKAAMD